MTQVEEPDGVPVKCDTTDGAARSNSSRRLIGSLHRSKSALGLLSSNFKSNSVTYAGSCVNIPVDDPLLNWVTDAVRALQSVGCGALDVYNVMTSIEKCIEEHRMSPHNSRIARHLGSSRFWTNLPLREAFQRMDIKYRITKRRHVPVSVHEIRQTFNLAQVLVSSRNLRLLSFDGDETLYRNGACFDDKELAELLINVIRHGCLVAVVTAAAYGQEPEPYERRLYGLLECMKQAQLSEAELANFLLFGGETNYLFRMGKDFHLHCVPYDEWEQFSPIGFTKERDLVAATELLDVAEEALRKAVIDLGLRTRLIRKERAVGIVPGGLRGLELVPEGSGAKTLRSEILEEAVARVREAIQQTNSVIPYCAFNGGQDVWVDVGNKAMALEILQNMFHIHPAECIHVGDQFTESGNDITVRQQSPCIWIVNPKETKAILRRLTRELCRKETEDDGFDDSGAE